MFFSTVDATFEGEVQGILPVSVSTDREKLWPFIEAAERKYILPLLERELYDDLQKFCNNRSAWQSGGSSGEDTTKTTELIRLIRIAELNLAYYSGFDVLNVKISDGGFQRVGDQGNFRGLYKYQEENLRKYFQATGYNGLDDMLKYIEDYIEYFPEWEDSVNYVARKVSIIKDAEAFDAICAISKSRITFLRLQRYMNEVIDFDIKPLMGDEYTTMMEELAKEDTLERYSLLRTEVAKPVAYYSVAKLIENSGSLTDRGLLFEGKNSMFPDDSTKKYAEGESAAMAAAQYRRIGDRYMDALRKYLIDNSFTEHGSAEGNVYDRDNTDKKTFVA